MPPATPALRRGILRLAAAALGAGLSLAAAELLLRSLGPERDSCRVWPPGLERVFLPAPGLLPGVSGPSVFRIDRLGFRSTERPPAPLLSVLALGGSTTECLYLDQSETWPALLQERLRATRDPTVWVANAGRSGRTTRDHVLQLRQLLVQPPRFDLLLLLAGTNDLASWLAGQAPDPTPPGESPELLARAFDVLPLARTPGGPHRRTALWNLLDAAHERFSRPPGMPQVEDEAAAIYATWRAHRRTAATRIERLPDGTAALHAFECQLAAIAELCQTLGVKLVLLTQPALWDERLPVELEGRLWMGGVGDYQAQPGCAYYSAGALARGLALFDERMRRFAAARGLPCLDLARAIGSDPRCFYDDVHFSEAGARAAAEFLARELVDRRLLP